MTINIGERYPFHSTVEGEYEGVYPRHYSGQTVEVIADVSDDDNETNEQMFKVRADDGAEFSAWDGELDGYFFNTDQWYRPDGTWVGWEKP